MPRRIYNRYSRRVKKTITFHNGVDSDTDPLLASLKDGKASYNLNMRINSNGYKHALDKVYGSYGIYEDDLATDITNLGGNPAQYKCIGARFVDSYHVAFYTSAISDPSLIAINGRVVLYSADFPISGDYYLQLDVNETGYGGEIFINDTVVKPMIFNVLDLFTEWNGGSPTSKYFADFDLNDHIVQLNTPMDQPVFIKLENVGGATGLPPGGYSYSLRYVDDDGNGTSWGPSTPVIPVVENYSDVCKTFRGVTTYGRGTDPIFRTKYGVRLRFRITNSGDFAAIELRRMAHIEGQSLDTQPQPQKYTVTVDIRSNPYNIYDFVDTSDKIWENLDDFTNEELAIINNVNAIRYYDNRLTLHGPTYLTKVIDDTDLFLESENGNIAYPYIANLEDIGFNSIQNQVYKKSYMHGERYGWALLCHDGSGGRSFALPYRTQNYPIGESYSESNYDTDVNLDASPTKIAQTFVCKGGILDKVSFYIKSIASPTGNITAELYDTSSGTPTGSSLATSSAVDASTVGGTYSLVNFNFLGEYIMTSGREYAIAIDYTGDAVNYISVGVDDSGPTHSGQAYEYAGSWGTAKTYDMCFYFYYGFIDFTNYQIPNRREPVSLDTSEFSEGVVTCADKNSNSGASPGETHEVMDNSGTVQKDDNFIINSWDHSGVSESYNPFTPAGDKSGGVNRHNVEGLETNVTSQVRHDATNYYTHPTQYNPEGWGHNYFAQGMSFEGVDESKFPDHIKSFSIVRTKPAGRVLCQGIGFYGLSETCDPLDPPTPATKSLNKVWFYSPDIDQNIGINTGLFDDIINNPSSYKVQLVSPVGLFSEVYSGYDMSTDSNRGYMIDMISYARILYENNKFNYGDALTDIGRLDGYVSFGRWRNTGLGSTGVESDTSKEYIFTITNAEQNSIEQHEGRSVYLELTLYTSYGSNNLYNTTGPSVGNEDFDDGIMKGVHEPLYIMNIINESAEVPTPNITEYFDTGFHQKLKSIVGFSNGEDVQQYALVDERKEDCLWGSHILSVGVHTGAPNASVLTDSNAGWVVDELIGYYIKNTTDGSVAHITDNTSTTVTGTLDGGTEDDWDTDDQYEIYCHKYVYINSKAWWALPSTVPDSTVFPGIYDDCLVALDASGVYDDGNRNVYGVCLCYEETGTGGDLDKIIIEFNQDALDTLYPGTTGYGAGFYVPSEDDKIEVWYDNRAPLLVFGGDTFIGDALFVPIDSYRFDYNTSSREFLYNLNMGFPYFKYDLAEIHQMWESSGPLFTGVNEAIQLNYVRQLAVLFTCESRINLSLLYNDSFPKKNYVQRPMIVAMDQWENGAEAMYEAHYMYPTYGDDYEDEYENWLYGGFHFPGTSNIDYSKYLIDRTSYNQPLVGFSERLEYPDRTMWSVERKNPGEIDSLKVFPVLNVFDGSDLSGSIRYAWAANTEKGDNLYKITDRGICILLTDKKLLNEYTGGQIGIIGSSEGFIQVEYWIRRDVGMNDYMWMSAAGIGNNLFFANTESVYWLAENEVTDIGRLDYHKVLYTTLKATPYKGGTPATTPRGVINFKDEEYWLCSGTGNTQHVFNYKNGVWVGDFNYLGDMFCSDKNRVYCVVGKDVFEPGSTLADKNFECHSIFPVNPNLGIVHQFKKIKIFSTNKPTSVQFSDTNFTAQATLSNALFGPYYLKDKGCYENKIPRKTSGSARFNNETLFVKVIHTADESFTLETVNIIANELKAQ